MPCSLPSPSRARSLIGAAACVAALAGSAAVWAHGDVTPQAVDTSSLPTLGDGWRSENRFRQNDAAVKVGTSAYNQNCARCRGLEAISGGVAPDLRKLDNDCATTREPAKKAACVKDNDEYYDHRAPRPQPQRRRREVTVAAGLASELESVLRGDARFAIAPLPSPRAPREGWAAGLAVKSDATDLAQALQVAVNQLSQSGRLKAIFERHNVGWRTA